MINLINYEKKLYVSDRCGVGFALEDCKDVFLEASEHLCGKSAWQVEGVSVWMVIH